MTEAILQEDFCMIQQRDRQLYCQVAKADLNCYEINL